MRGSRGDGKRVLVVVIIIFEVKCRPVDVN